MRYGLTCGHAARTLAQNFFTSTCGRDIRPRYARDARTRTHENPMTKQTAPMIVAIMRQMLGRPQRAIGLCRHGSHLVHTGVTD